MSAKLATADADFNKLLILTFASWQLERSHYARRRTGKRLQSRHTRAQQQFNR